MQHTESSTLRANAEARVYVCSHKYTFSGILFRAYTVLVLACMKDSNRGLLFGLCCLPNAAIAETKLFHTVCDDSVPERCLVSSYSSYPTLIHFGL